MAESKFPKSPWREKARKRLENRDMLDFSFSVAIRILTLMKKNGLTQKELAEKLSVTPQYLSKYLKGNTAPNFRLIKSASRFFGEEIVTVTKEEPTIKTKVTAKKDLRPYISNNLGNIHSLQDFPWAKDIQWNRKRTQYTPNC
jgi:transcriptional regulator with XRE-family HTH domain